MRPMPSFPARPSCSRDEGTGITKETVSNESGLFSFPDLNHGSHQVTVKLTGFQTAVVSQIAVEAAPGLRIVNRF